MTSTEFWKIIDSTGRGHGPRRKKQVEKIVKILKSLEIEEVGSFMLHVRKALEGACTFHFMVAAFTVLSRLSDDTFLDFRAWVMLLGRKTFSKAVKNPDTIAEVLSRDEVDEVGSYGIVELPTRLWLDRGGGMKAYADEVGLWREPSIATSWPKTRKSFEKRYPILYRAFWNQERINSYHEREEG